MCTEPIEDVNISGQITAIEQGNRELDIVGVEAVTLSERPCCGTDLDAQVPELLREAPDGILKRGLGAGSRVQEENVDIRVRAQQAPAKSTERDQSEAGRLLQFGRNEFLPETVGDVLDQASATRDCGTTVTSRLEVLINARRFLRIEIAKASA